MIQQAGKAPGAQGGEGKSFPSAELCSAAKQVIDHDTSSSEQGTCSSSLHFTEGKEGILAVSLPSSSAFTAGNRMLEECGIPQPSSPSSRVGSTSTAKPLQFSAQLINTNWKRCGLTYQAANCSAWCMDLARRPFRRDAGNGEDFGYLFAHSCTNSQSPGAQSLTLLDFVFPTTISCRSALVNCTDLHLFSKTPIQATLWKINS